MIQSRRKQVVTLLGIGISVLLIWVLFRNIDFVQLADVLKSANYWWLAPNAAMIIVTMYQRAYRWQAMLNPIKRVRMPRLIAATSIGFMANNVLPLRLGEFVRAYSLAYSDRSITKSASLATIFVERMVFDLVALLLILAMVLSFSDFRLDNDMILGVQLTVVIALLAIVFMIILALKPERSGELLTRYLPFLPGRLKETVKQIVVRFSQGLLFLKEKRAVVAVAVQTLLIWILMGYSNYFVFRAFDIRVPIDASFVVLVVVSISILVPSSPGFVGVYHAGAVWALSHYSVESESAIAFAVVLHATQYLVVTVMGFYFLKREHLSLQRLSDDAVSNI